MSEIIEEQEDLTIEDMEWIGLDAGLRTAALDAAVKVSAPSGPENVLKAARAFYDFLTGDAGSNETVN